ncbi:hypothetical protein TYRP_005370 [Tyrophagus putrescentiae]|nr:hypothetical protein TYRP_005370 [Tyrophagus putrescentiae]
MTLGVSAEVSRRTFELLFLEDFCPTLLLRRSSGAVFFKLTNSRRLHPRGGVHRVAVQTVSRHLPPYNSRHDGATVNADSQLELLFRLVANGEAADRLSKGQ